MTNLSRCLLPFFAGLLLLGACVPNKKYLYLQKDDLHQKDLVKDSVYRMYSPINFDYRIQPNDALFVRFESITDEQFDFLSNQGGVGGGGAVGQAILINSELVDEQGNINFPILGKVKVSGLTLFEIQEKLQTIAEGYLEAPVVKVRLVNFRFTVLGEVNQEGTVTTLNNRVTLPEALGLSGGLGELADRSKIKVLRQIDGRIEIAYINLLDENFINSPYYFLNQSDILVVPPLRQRPYRRYFGQNLGVFLSSLTLILFVINQASN